MGFSFAPAYVYRTERRETGSDLGGFSFATFPKIELGSHDCMKAAAWLLFRGRVAPEGAVTVAPKITSPEPIEVPLSAGRAALGVMTTRSNAKKAARVKSAADKR